MVLELSSMLCRIIYNSMFVVESSTVLSFFPSQGTSIEDTLVWSLSLLVDTFMIVKSYRVPPSILFGRSRS
jgi:hypothetical protein